MLNAVKAAMVMADKMNLAVDLTFAEGQCQIKTESFDKGRYEDSITAQGDFSFVVNGRMLIDALSALSSCLVTLRANSPTTPIIFDGDEGDPMMLVMPIKLKEVPRDAEDAA